MDIEAVIKQFVTKIYTHTDGSLTVNIGVHTIGGEGGSCIIFIHFINIHSNSA